MEIVKINGRAVKVFVLKKGEEKWVVIPVTYLHRVDYERLKDVEKKSPKNMLDVMKKTVLDNGKNMLAQFDKLILVVEAPGTEKLTPAKRGPGRPPGSGKKKETSEAEAEESEEAE